MPTTSSHDRVVQRTAGKTRDLPIRTDLADILQAAAEEAEVDIVLVYSGGQCALGTCDKRTGSTRHDLGNAADLQLWKDGQALDFRDNDEREVFALFAKSCARLGATGIGGGIGYMGPLALHIGYGAKAIWGANGASANAPDWLRLAVLSGWAERTGESFGAADATGPFSFDGGESSLGLDSDDEEDEESGDAPSLEEMESEGFLES